MKTNDGKEIFYNGKWKRKDKEIIKGILLGIQLCILIVMCLIHARVKGNFVDFFPINGTFQNYNPVRRFLAGQIPWQDFNDYLGLGHLYMGSLFTFLFGGTYRASLMAFSFLTSICAVMLFLVIGYTITKDTFKTVTITNIIFVIIFTHPGIIIRTFLLDQERMEHAIAHVLDVQNSARFVRGQILPFILIFFFLGYTICYKKFKNQKKLMSICALFGGGVIAGLSFPWSNDFGISTWVCTLLMIAIISLVRTRNVLKALLNSIVALMISILTSLVVVFVLTRGHAVAWLLSTFGTGGYQSWYYFSPKHFYLYEIDYSVITLLQAALAVVYGFLLIKHRASSFAIRRYGVLMWINMTAYCAINEYHFLSGGTNQEVAMVIFYATILFEVISAVFQFLPFLRKTEYLICLLGVICGVYSCFSLTSEIVYEPENEENVVMIEELGGGMTSLGNDLLETKDFLQDSTVFSTYSSALEVICNSFQPSGYDYIIHVLGDSQREKYMESFSLGNFDYVSTINISFTNWEYWIRRANWFFYRELYEDWIPVFSNSYATYWEKSDDAKNAIVKDDITVTIENADGGGKNIVIETKEDVNGIADVYLDYRVSKEDSLKSKLIWKMAAKIMDGSMEKNFTMLDSNYLRSEGQEFIPIEIINGKGFVNISSYPEEGTMLQINKVECERIFRVE